ncbi:Zinc knuckle [Popillia japonica]|uniref:Zinc knuckle n=1 Tax=Popillia japonica TaxID=7064 RepID=A0AAW1I8G3_POPJA
MPLHRMTSNVLRRRMPNAKMLEMLQISQQNQQQTVRVNSNQDIKNFNIMPDLSKTIDKFNGEMGPVVAKTWLRQIESTSLLHSWPDAFAYETARSNLEGAAKYWLKGRYSTVTDWHTFKNAFKKTFIYEKSKSECWQRMQAHIQGVKENSSAYFHEKVALCQELDLSFKETKEQLVIGLQSRELSNFIMSKDHIDVDELFQDMMTHERIVKSRRDRKEPEGNRDGRVIPVPGLRRGFTGNQPSRNRNAAEMKCFNCGLIGHGAAECTKPQRPRGSCYQCGAAGHVRRSCPQLQRSNPDVPRAQDDFERFTQENAGEPNTNTHSSNQYADAIQALIAQNAKMLEMLQISQQNQQQTVRVT